MGGGGDNYNTKYTRLLKVSFRSWLLLSKAAVIQSPRMRLPWMLSAVERTSMHPREVIGNRQKAGEG